MSVNVTMPKMGMTMKEGKISKWLKSEGDTIQKEEPLFEVETEKITNVVEAVADGILFQIVVSADTLNPPPSPASSKHLLTSFRVSSSEHPLKKWN